MADAVARPTAGGPAGTPPAAPTPGVVSRLVAFYHGVMAEMKKVTWPDIAQVRSATISIIIFVLLIGLLITVLDFILQGLLIKMIPSLFAGR
ncbi:MAG TPA: preprotein translocase subunit SecE [Gemmatimonadaceae bacterium]|jgi:preprotein translocase subunit SecE